MAFRVSRIFQSIGIGSVLAGLLIGYPVTAAINFGGDHLRPAWDKQWYAVRSYLGEPMNDRIIMYQCDWATAGNILTLKNQMNEGAGRHRIDEGFKVVGASFNDTRTDIGKSAGSNSIMTGFGDFTYFKSGFYVYTSGEKKPNSQQSEVITLHLQNERGIIADVDLQILIYETDKTANLMADYGNEKIGPNTRINGLGAYQTAMTEGAMLISFVNDDMLVGSDASDAIFSWKGSDRLLGLEGDDFVAGEYGINFLTGGPGADHFQLHTDKGQAADLFDTIIDYSPDEGDVLNLRPSMMRLWKGHELDRGTPSQYIWTEASEDHLEVFVRSPSNGGHHHLARILAHPGFKPTQVNIRSLLQSGHIIF